MALDGQKVRGRRIGSAKQTQETMFKSAAKIFTNVNQHHYRLSHQHRYAASAALLDQLVVAARIGSVQQVERSPRTRATPVAAAGTVSAAAAVTLGQRGHQIDQSVASSSSSSSWAQQQVIISAIGMQHQSVARSTSRPQPQQLNERRTGMVAGNESIRVRADEESLRHLARNRCLTEDNKRTRRSNAMKRPSPTATQQESAHKYHAVSMRSNYVGVCAAVALVVSLISSVPLAAASNSAEPRPETPTAIERLASATKSSIESVLADVDRDTLMLKSMDVQRTNRLKSASASTQTGTQPATNGTQLAYTNATNQFLNAAPQALAAPLDVLDKSGSSNYIDRRVGVLDRRSPPTESSSPKFVLTNELDQYLDDMNHNELRTVASGRPIDDLFHSRPLTGGARQQQHQQQRPLHEQHKASGENESHSSADDTSRAKHNYDAAKNELGAGAPSRAEPGQSAAAAAAEGDQAPARLDESQSERQVYSECALILQRTYVKNIGDPK